MAMFAREEERGEGVIGGDFRQGGGVLVEDAAVDVFSLQGEGAGDQHELGCGEADRLHLRALAAYETGLEIAALRRPIEVIAVCGVAAGISRTQHEIPVVFFVLHEHAGEAGVVVDVLVFDQCIARRGVGIKKGSQLPGYVVVEGGLLVHQSRVASWHVARYRIALHEDRIVGADGRADGEWLGEMSQPEVAAYAGEIFDFEIDVLKAYFATLQGYLYFVIHVFGSSAFEVQADGAKLDAARSLIGKVDVQAVICLKGAEVEEKAASHFGAGGLGCE